MRVLLVENQESVRSALILMLELAGFEVTAFSDGEKALSALMQRPEIGVLICDCHLPDMSGLELVKALRVQGDRTPAVLLSGPTNGKFVTHPAEVDAVVFKPFTFKELERGIQAAIQRREG
jgi:DNA-binding response OmpR family regulator